MREQIFDRLFQDLLAGFAFELVIDRDRRSELSDTRIEKRGSGFEATPPSPRDRLL